MTWTADSLSHLATGYWPAATLIAAVQLRVFDAIGDESKTAHDAAAALDVPAARLESLLDALVAIGLLVKADATYSIVADARPFLCRDSPKCLLDALAYNADLYRQWANLADVVRGDASLPTGDRQLGGDPLMTRRFVLGMDAKARAFAPAIADHIDLGDATTLLDVGSGPGTLTRALLDRHPGVTATLLDLPAVLAVAEEVCRSTPAGRRLTYHPADYRADALPGPFDVAVYSGALHQETPQSAAALFAKFRHCLRPGSHVFVIDLMLDDGRTSPAFSALFQLNMMLRRPGSRVFTSGETIELLTAAGFDDVETTIVEGTPYRVVRAALVPSPGNPGEG